MRQVEFLILGAGPCGLGAGFRLKELGIRDFLIVEALDHPGGLASSYRDEKGFTWDVGGHVQFSHYEDFDRVMDLALPGGWLTHERESWVWIFDRFVPYPFQNNLGRLPLEIQTECLQGLALAQITATDPKNFGDWIGASFGNGIARIFMRPYNYKVWAYPPEMMSYEWIGERVATVDLERVKKNIRDQRDDVSWGPNATFRFPKVGGTGAIWKAVASLVGADRIQYRTKLVGLDLQEKIATLETNDQRASLSYRHLLSTLPLTQLCQISGGHLKGPLLSSNSHIVGIGLKGQTPDFLKTKCWMYFPETNCPFYRVTVFSNYSPHNVPDENHWSLMCETSSSPLKRVDESRLIEETIQGLLNTKLIESRSDIVSKWQMTAAPGYPTPFLNRNKLIDPVIAQFDAVDVSSRGRFGVWKYEVSNQDHTFMQGFEWADFKIRQIPELTWRDPAAINQAGKRALR